jgi:hypothetical protein
MKDLRNYNVFSMPKQVEKIFSNQQFGTRGYTKFL